MTTRRAKAKAKAKARAIAVARCAVKIGGMYA
jgi:hypothetical protein